jgi:hypothetical protein
METERLANQFTQPSRFEEINTPKTANLIQSSFRDFCPVTKEDQHELSQSGTRGKPRQCSERHLPETKEKATCRIIHIVSFT